MLLDGQKWQPPDHRQVASPLKGSLGAKPYASWAQPTQLGCEGPQATPSGSDHLPWVPMALQMVASIWVPPWHPPPSLRRLFSLLLQC